MDAKVVIQEESLRWRAVLARDARFDGMFVYGVRSTGIYCRPSCPSRRPRRDRVELFNDPESAEQAGFRPCLRCRPKDERSFESDTAEVMRACRHLQSLEDAAPPLAGLSAELGTTPARLTHVFRKVLGITPWQYADALQAERLRAGLRDGASVTTALYEAGYSSPSRVYERADRLLGMTPRSYRDGGKGTRIAYTVVPCIAGQLLVAVTAKGVCAVHLGDDESALERGLLDQFATAEIRRDDEDLREIVRQVAALLGGPAAPKGVALDVQATAFQRRVWQELQAIPYGEVRTYGEVAEAIGEPSAARAVARACATNPVAIVVPCHRVVPAAGGTGGYRWGAARKAALLEHERRDR